MTTLRLLASPLAVLPLVLFLLASSPTSAQNDVDTAFRYGAWVAGGLDMHTADFSKFTDVGFCCPDAFGAQSGFSARLGGLIRFQPWDVLDKRLVFDARLGVGYSSAEFSTVEQTLFNDPTNGNNETVEGSFDYVISPSVMSATLDLAPTVTIIDGLAAHAGVRLGFLFADSYTQTERISSEFADQGFIFTDTQSSERNLADGPIPGLNAVQMSIIAGLSWEFPLDREGTVFIAPEIFYVHGLSNISSAVSMADGSAGSWSASSIQGGVSLRFALVETVKPDPCDTIIDGVLQSKPCPEGEVLVFDAETNECGCKDTTTVVDSIIVRINSVRGVGPDGRTGEGEVLVVEGFKTRHWRPLLPFVFFDRGSDQLDLVDGYADITPQARMSFEEDPSFERDWHRHVLNIIGKRMFQDPESRIDIFGYHVPAEVETDSMGIERAYAVRDYLYRRWSIGFDRMTVQSGGVRALPQGALPAEGRAVEIRSASTALFDPIEMPGMEVVIRPSHVQIHTTIESGAGREVSSVQYELRLGGGQGRRPRPLRATFNAGDPGFDSALVSWTAPVGEPDSKLFEAITSQMDADDLILLPSLTVTFSNGQKIEAEQDVKRTTLTLPTLTPEQKKERGLADTAVLVLDVLFTDAQSAELSSTANAYLDKVLASVPKGAPGYLERDPIDDASRAFDGQLFERRREAVRAAFRARGFQLQDTPHTERDDLPASTPKGATYGRAIRAILWAPIR